MKRLALATLIFFVLPAATASADRYEHKKGKVEISFDESYWKVDASDEDSISAEAKDSSAFLVFGVLDAKDLDKLDIEKELDELIKDPKIDENKKIKHNGMDGWLVNGSGKVEGQKMDFAVLFLVTPGGKVVMGLGFGLPGKYNQAQVDKVFDSIKPIR